MVKGKGLAAILCGIFLLCTSLQVTSEATSASAHITLVMRPLVQIRDAHGSSSLLLCMSHIPARHYSVRYLTAKGGQAYIKQWQDNRPCLPVSDARDYTEILIEAD